MISLLPRLVVAASGSVLVASAVSVPSGDVDSGVAGSGEGCSDVADFVAGKGNHCFVVVRGCGRWCLCAVVCGGDGEEGVGEYGQGGPAMPGGPGADLVFVQPGASLAGLEVSSIRQRVPATRTSVCRLTPRVAWHRK